MDGFNFLYSALASVSVSAALTLSLGFILRVWITERLRSSIKHEYDDKLENLKSALKTQSDAHLAQLKADVDRAAEKLQIAAASFSDVQKATISKKIEAVDHIWAAVRKARGQIPAEVYVADVLTSDELLNLDKQNSTRALLSKLQKLKPLEIAPKLFEGADVARPHVGEVVWSLYCAYFGIITRCLFLLQGDARGTDRLWFQDAAVRRMIQSAFGENALSEFEGLEFQRLAWLQSRFDQRLFSAFDNLLTGKAFSEAALAQAMETERVIADIDANTAKASYTAPLL